MLKQIPRFNPQSPGSVGVEWDPVVSILVSIQVTVVRMFQRPDVAKQHKGFNLLFLSLQCVCRLSLIVVSPA